MTTSPAAGDTNLGLDNNARLATVESLRSLLADTYAVYGKTHGYHWNVQGANFQALHALFEEQYREMWAALDELAERMRALGAFAPSNSASLLEGSPIDPAGDAPLASDRMVADLLGDQETLIRRARTALATAEEAGDAASADLITVRIQTHEKMAWMLRATAG
ncbi:MAG: DNA starvation/stationary phase protection protein [Pseudomonadota bacterium]